MMLLLLLYCSSLLLHICGASSSLAQRPAFVQHLTAQDLTRAKEIAQQRHEQAVRTALDNYPTDDIAIDANNSFKNLTLCEYTIDAPTQLPDFADIIRKAVYVADVFSRDECRAVVQSAHDHYRNEDWPMHDSGQYRVAGFWIRDVPAVHEWFVTMCRQRLFPALAQQFPNFVESPEDLVVDNAYLFQYNTETGRRTDVHTDSGCLSFTIALNEPEEEYTGGGTWFEGLQDSGDDNHVLSMKAGQVTIRPGGVKHAGYPVTSGTRYIIGGFCMNRRKVEVVRMLLSTATDGGVSVVDRTLCLEAAVALNPECDAAYSLLANHYEEELQDPARAQEVLEYCLEHVHGSSGEVAYYLGSMAMKEPADYAKAWECMQICLQSDPEDVDAMATAAQALAGLQRSDEELAMWQRVVATPGAKAATYAAAYCNLGVLREGKEEEVQYYLAALKHWPESFASRYSLASAYGTRKEFDKAVEHFRAAVDCADGDEENALKALNGLYRAAMGIVQQDSSLQPGDQALVMERFQEIMGAENLDRLRRATAGK